MEICGSETTFNLENVLRQNIISSDYFRDTCLKLSTWEEVVDEIYYNVDHVEPWMSGNARGASTAFCLLYRLFTMKISVRQVKELLVHPDSPYIRAIGFLYLRYVGDPKTIWSWYEPYLEDDQELSASPIGPTVTIGDFVIDIFLGQYYFETIFPRVPKKVMDSCVEKLKQRGLRTEAKGNGGVGGADRRGVDEPNRRPASVKASLSVAFGQRAPNRSNAREDGRARDPSLWAGDARKGREAYRKRERRSRSRSPDRYRKTHKETAPRDRERHRSRSHSRSRQRRERDRRRSRSRSPSGRSRHRHHSRHSRSHSRHRDRDRARHRARDRERDRRRSRTRSPDRHGRSRSHDKHAHQTDRRDVRDVFKESAPSRGEGNLKLVYGS